MEKFIKFTLQAEWDEVEKARNKTSKFLISYGLSEEKVQALVMVVSELVENSIKYGKFVLPENEVAVDIHVSDRSIIVEVINPVDGTVYNHLKELDRTIQWIRGFQNPFEAYVERLKGVSKKPLNDEESGIGLTRIAYEGKAIIDFFLSEDDFLNVCAVSDA